MANQKMLRRGGVAFLLLISSLAHGNTEQVIRSLYSPTDRFLIVTEDSTGASGEGGGSKRAPGLYVQGEGKKPQWNKVFSGKFSFKTETGFFLSQFKIGQWTNKVESLAVINGKITLFNVHSSETAPESFVQFGYNALLRDISNNTRLKLPPIDDQHEVVVYTPDRVALKDGQMVLVSIRSDSYLLGDGVTFAFKAKNDSEGNGYVTLESEPVILDHSFYPLEQLSRFINADRQVAMPLMATQLIENSAGENADVVVKWRKKLERFKSSLKSLEIIPTEGPYWSWESGDVVTTEPPMKIVGEMRSDIAGELMRLSQQYSFRGESFIEVSGQGARPPARAIFRLPGKIDLDEKGELVYHRFDGTTGHIAGGESQLFSANGDVYLISLGHVIKIYDGLKRGGLGPSIEEISLSLADHSGDDGSYSFLLSLKTGEKQWTELLSLKKGGREGRESFFVDHRLEFSSEYYPQEELKARISEHNGQVYFDDKTPPQGEKEAYNNLYRNRYRETSPHLNMTRSILEGEKTYAYLYPEETAKIGDLQYRRYPVDAKDQSIGGTGLYFNDQYQLGTQLLPIDFAEGVGALEEGSAKKESKKGGNAKGGKKKPKYTWYEREIDHKGQKVARVQVLMGDGPLSDGSSITNPIIAASLLNSPQGSVGLLKGGEIDPGKINFIQSLFHSYSKEYGEGEVVETLRVDLFFHHNEVDENLEAYAKALNAEDSLEERPVMRVQPLKITRKLKGDIPISLEIAESGRWHSFEAPDGIEEGNFHDMIYKNGDDIYLKVAGSPGEFDFGMIDIEDTSGEVLFPYGRDKQEGTWNITEFEELSENKGDSPFIKRSQNAKVTGMLNAWGIATKPVKGIDKGGELKKGVLGDWGGESSVDSSGMFSNLVESLNDLADSGKSPEHIVFTVPAQLKPYVASTILDMWGKEGLFGKTNKNLGTYYWSPKPESGPSLSLESMSDYLQVVGSAEKKKRAVLLVDADKVITTGRLKPENSENEFKLEFMNTEEADGLSGGAQAEAVSPHALYLLATEGKQVGLDDFSGGKMAPSGYSQFILATEEEWEKLKGTMAEKEMAYGLGEHFKVVQLSEPDREYMIESMERMFREKDIANLNLEFDLEGIVRPGVGEDLSLAEKQRRIFGFFASSILRLSETNKLVPAVAFGEALMVLRGSLFTDQRLRVDRTVNRALLERVLPRVFKMPLRLESLPESHWLSKVYGPHFLKDIREIGGYDGGNKLFSTIRDTLKGLARPLAGRKNSAASFLLYGPPGKGKSQAFLSFIKAMGIKLYRPNLPPDEKVRAGAFIFDGKELTSKENALEVIGQFEDFLYYSAHASEIHYHIDDIHKAEVEARQELIKILNKTMDNESGYWIVTKGGMAKRIPVRNMVPWVSCNPASERDTPGGGSEPVWGDEKQIIAAINKGKAGIVDKSFLERFAQRLLVGGVTGSAMSASLASSFNEVAKNIFYDGKYVAFSPRTILSVSRQFSDVDPRNFLADSASGLAKRLELARDHGKGGEPLEIVVLQEEIGDVENAEGKNPESLDSESLRPEGRENKLSRYLVNSLSVLNVTESAYGRLKFIELIANNFRRQMFHALAGDLRYNPSFGQVGAIYDHYLPWIEKAIQDHVRERPFLPLSALPLDTLDFDYSTERGKIEFQNIIRSLSDKKWVETPYFPGKMFEDGLERKDILKVLTEPDYYSEHKGVVTREVINARFALDVGRVMREELASRLALEKLELLHTPPSPEEWAGEHLNGHVSVSDFATGDEMINQTKAYLAQMGMEHTDVDGVLNPYESIRFWSLVVDRAIASLPWEQVSRFLIETISAAAGDLDLGSRPEVLKYFFENPSSLLKPVVVDLSEVIPETNEKSRLLKESSVERNRGSFDDMCKRYLE